MFKGLGNIATLLKQAQTLGPKMQAQMEEVKQERFQGSAGGGMVTVEANGASEILSIKVDPVLSEKNDLEMVLDLVPGAVNDVLEKVKRRHAEVMTSELPVPAGMQGMLDELMGSLPSGSADEDGPESDADGGKAPDAPTT